MSLAQRKDASKVSKHGRPVEDTWTHPTNPNKGNTRMHRLVDKWERAVASHAAKARLTNLHHRIRKRARIQSRHDSRDFADVRHRFEDTTTDRISSRFAGVFWIEARKKWRVTIYLSRSNREYFGEYENEEEAAKAYDKRARVLGKETNFDDNGNERVRARAKNHSRHWGVSFYKRYGLYQGRASIGKQQLDLGGFVDETRAALAHDALARARPENKRFNFILKHAGHETAAET